MLHGDEMTRKDVKKINDAFNALIKSLNNGEVNIDYKDLGPESPMHYLFGDKGYMISPKDLQTLMPFLEQDIRIDYRIKGFDHSLQVNSLRPAMLHVNDMVYLQIPKDSLLDFYIHLRNSIRSVVMFYKKIKLSDLYTVAK